jgi:hypothetical protein
MSIGSKLLASISMATTLTIAVIIVVIPFSSNLATIANAQQQEQPTSQSEVTEDATTTTTAQSAKDSFRVQVPQGWVIHDVDNTVSTSEAEVLQGYGILAQLCPDEQQEQGAPPNGSGSTNRSSITTSNSCQGAQEEVIHILRYPDLDTRLQAANNVTTNNNIMTTDNILSYHLQKLQEVGYRSIRIVNSTDMTLDVTNPQTNETIATVPAKLVEMTYSTNFAPNETRIGYFISTATNATTPNPGTTKGYSVFYEGNSTTTNTTTPATAAEITTATTAASGSLLLTPLPPAVGQVFDSFELIVAPELAQAITQEEAQTAETTEGGDSGANDDDDDGANDDDDDGANDDDDDGETSDGGISSRGDRFAGDDYDGDDDDGANDDDEFVDDDGA